MWTGVLAAVALWGTAMGIFDALLRQVMQVRYLNFNTSLLLGWGALLEQSVTYLPVSVSKRVSSWFNFFCFTLQL